MVVASKISEGNIRHVPSSDDNNISLVQSPLLTAKKSTTDSCFHATYTYIHYCTHQLTDLYTHANAHERTPTPPPPTPTHAPWLVPANHCCSVDQPRLRISISFLCTSSGALL